MSAQLAEQSAILGAAGHLSNRFSAHLALAAGVTVSIHALTMRDLGEVVAKLQPTEAANEGNAAQGPAPAPSPTGTAAPTAAPKPTAAASTPAAAAAAAPSQASTAAGEAGNAGTISGTAGAGTASSNAGGESSAVSFDVVKKAFLALSQSKGRATCEAVLQQFKLAKLSDAKSEQHAAVLAAIEAAGK